MKAAAQIATVVLPLVLFASTSAQAQQPEQEIEIGTKLVCDTEAQAEMFVARFDGDAQSSAERVNQEVANPTACAVTTMAYLRGPQMATASNKGFVYEIAKIIVVGVVTEAGLQPVTPAAYYSVFKLDEIEV